jgi:hypothetical protein
MSQPTYDDVNLILKLYDLRREAKLREARGWFFAHFRCKTMADFGQLCPMGSETNASYRQVTSYWDMAASFVNGGVLNPELFFANSRELLFCWERVKPIIGEVRKAYADPNHLGNLEKAGTAYAEWFSKTSGVDAYKSFVARVG